MTRAWQFTRKMEITFCLKKNFVSPWLLYTHTYYIIENSQTSQMVFLKNSSIYIKSAMLLAARKSAFSIRVNYYNIHTKCARDLIGRRRRICLYLYIIIQIISDVQKSFMGCTRSVRLICAFQNSCNYNDYDVREYIYCCVGGPRGPHSKNELINVA